MLKYQIYQSKLAGTSAYRKFYARIGRIALREPQLRVAQVGRSIYRH